MQTKYVWNVIHFNINARKMEAYNILAHTSFRKDIADMMLCRRKTFDERLKRTAQYYFWARCEWEVIISEWPPAPPERNVEEKVDVFSQLNLNWDRFADYVWKHRRELYFEYQNLDR